MCCFWDIAYQNSKNNRQRLIGCSKVHFTELSNYGKSFQLTYKPYTVKKISRMVLEKYRSKAQTSTIDSIFDVIIISKMCRPYNNHVNTYHIFIIHVCYVCSSSLFTELLEEIAYTYVRRKHNKKKKKEKKL